MGIRKRSTTQDISWFLDLNTLDQIDLNPPYQRRSIWSVKDKRFFLDTIFNGYPSPAIFLHKKVEEGKTIYSVVDGKQRLETIFMFANNKLAMDKEFGDKRLDGKKWKNIIEHSDLSNAFWDYVLPVEFVETIDNRSLINEIFDRLNRNSRRLVEQELRHAWFGGWFITYVEMESDQEEWAELGISTRARSKRMRDVQFLSELLMVIMKGEVEGFDQDNISRYYANYEVLTDSEDSIDKEATIKQFNTAKSYLLGLERHGEIIRTYARDFKNFYSLWAIVALHLDELPSVEDFATKYSVFMKDVGQYNDPEYLSKINAGKAPPKSTESFNYFINNIGANTDFPKREARNSAFLSGLL